MSGGSWGGGCLGGLHQPARGAGREAAVTRAPLKLNFPHLKSISLHYSFKFALVANLFSLHNNIEKQIKTNMFCYNVLIFLSPWGQRLSTAASCF